MGDSIKYLDDQNTNWDMSGLEFVPFQVPIDTPKVPNGARPAFEFESILDSFSKIF